MDDYSVGFAVGMICALLAGVLLIVVLMRAMKKKGMQNDRCKFDERQELVRGKGGKYAFFTLMIYNAVYGFADMLFGLYFVENIVGIFFGVLLGILVYVIYCIWNEGYIALNEDRGKVIVIFAVLGVLNFVIATVEFLEGTVVRDGVLTFRSMNLFCGLMMVIILGAMALKERCRKKEEEAL